MIQSVRPSGNGQSGPPDLEALVSSLQSRFRNAPGKRPIMVIMIAVVILLALIWGGCHPGTRFSRRSAPWSNALVP